jgi:TolA-binding protein
MRNILREILGVSLILVVMNNLSADDLKAAEGFIKRGDYEEAIKVYEQIISKTPVNFQERKRYEEALYGLQTAYRLKGELTKALKIKDISFSDRLIWGQIRILFYLNQYDTIPQLVHELIKQYPKSKFLNDALRLSLLITEAKDDTNGLGIYAQALYNYEVQKYDAGISALQTLILKPTILAEYGYLLLSRQYLAKNEPNYAIGVLNEFSSRFPKSRLIPEAKYQLATLYLEVSKDTLKARDLLEDIIFNYPATLENYLARNKLKGLKETFKDMH